MAGREPPLHVHHGEDEAFYVLEGDFTFHVGGHLLPAPAGTLVFLPREVAHGFCCNRSSPRHRQLDAAGFADIRPAHELVDHLEERGYLVRTPDPDDGRAKLVRLTAQGWEAVEVASAALRDIEARWEAVLGPRRMTSLRRSLAALPAILESGRGEHDAAAR